MAFFRKHQNSAPHIATGASGEAEAARFLTAQGFSLVARNWRPSGKARNLELDLIGKWEASLVFVEVKTRRVKAGETEEHPAAIHNFSPAKQRNMIRAVRAYLTEHDAWSEPCRFDLVCVTLLPGNSPQLEHYRDVIELGQTVDSGDASWQPW
ncbi:YraN family protein [Desulfovibrio sp. OttesenSCG-928-O18]|nr:YraN family protein [Desulfovibrio sp. OttesenSCG-928-O18]